MPLDKITGYQRVRFSKIQSTRLNAKKNANHLVQFEAKDMDTINEFLQYVKSRGYKLDDVGDKIHILGEIDKLVRRYIIEKKEKFVEAPLTGARIIVSFQRGLPSVTSTIYGAKSDYDTRIRELGSWARGFNDDYKLERANIAENELLTKNITGTERKILKDLLNTKVKHIILDIDQSYYYTTLENFVKSYGLPYATLPYKISTIRYINKKKDIEKELIMLTATGVAINNMEKIVSNMIDIYNDLVDKGFIYSSKASILTEPYKLNSRLNFVNACE